MNLIGVDQRKISVDPRLESTQLEDYKDSKDTNLEKFKGFYKITLSSEVSEFVELL